MDPSDVARLEARVLELLDEGQEIRLADLRAAFPSAEEADIERVQSSAQILHAWLGELSEHEGRSPQDEEQSWLEPGDRIGGYVVLRRKLHHSRREWDSAPRLRILRGIVSDTHCRNRLGEAFTTDPFLGSGHNDLSVLLPKHERRYVGASDSGGPSSSSSTNLPSGLMMKLSDTADP